MLRVKKMAFIFLMDSSSRFSRVFGFPHEMPPSINTASSWVTDVVTVPLLPELREEMNKDIGLILHNFNLPEINRSAVGLQGNKSSFNYIVYPDDQIFSLLMFGIIPWILNRRISRR